MKDKVEELLSKTFISLRSDYGFKRNFSSPEHAEVLMNFLNALFEGKLVVTDITFRDKEVLPPDSNGKRIVYDAYCTTNTGHHFVVEMQRKQSKLFGKRMVFYISSCVFRQGESGGSYNFDPVFLIVITDFDMNPFEKQLVNEVVLMERNTGVVFTEDFKIFFLSLSRVNADWDQCKTELERRLFLVKNMDKLNKESKPYKCGRYADMFKASEIASMAAEDIVAYRNSLRIEMERQSELEFAKEEGLEEGLQKGMEKGIEEGIEKGKMDVARRLKQNGMSMGDLMLFTGLSEAQIMEL